MRNNISRHVANGSRESILHEVIQKFFVPKNWKPFRFQREVWNRYLDHEDGLLHSPTGTGKTLAVWLAPILEWYEETQRLEVSMHAPPPLTVLWITPLRALSADTLKSLSEPAEVLGIPWTIQSRTSDSSASRKLKQLQRLPTALVTTPESLTLMLTYEQLQTQLSGCRLIVIDEWHELLGSKRGIQTELALARLRAWNPNILTWGISATLGNIEHAARTLVGTRKTKIAIVQGAQKKKLSIESIIPKSMESFPWSGHIGTHLVKEVLGRIENKRTSLVFTNTRSQTEIWYQALLTHKKEYAGQLALHHGSLDSKVRHWVEEKLRQGKLKAVVCTSSLDLGVDFSEVDYVVQIGSPKGTARLLQRAGRCGHQPNGRSELAFVPTHAIELIELAAAKSAIQLGVMESRPTYKKPLDVLAQHLVTIAIGGGFKADELFNEVRCTEAYRDLGQEEWNWTLAFVTKGGGALNAYPDFHRVHLQDERYVVTESKIISRHRMNIGTIVSDVSMKIQYLSGATLGTAEEGFLSRLKTDAKFMFAGKVLSLVRIHGNTAYVRRSKGVPDAIPRWMGGRMPLSSELAAMLRKKLAQASQGILVGPEMKALRRIFMIQQRWSCLPKEDEVLIEATRSRNVSQLFIFPFEGRLVHEGLGAMLAFRYARIHPTTISLACNDYGLLLESREPFDIDSSILEMLFDESNIEEDILTTLNASEMARRQFREIARIAGLIHGGYPGQSNSQKNLQASSNLFFDAFQNFDPHNLLLLQCHRELMDRQLEMERLKTAIRRIAKCTKRIETPKRITPLSFPLWVDRLRDQLSSETLENRIKKMLEELEFAAQEESL